MVAASGSASAALQAALPPDTVVTDPARLESYRDDAATWVRGGMPAALVLARTTQDVAVAVGCASEAGTPIVVRGAGSGLSGGASAIEGCVVLCLERMTEVLLVDAEEQLAVVQPGALNVDVKRSAEEAGLWYPPDPASWEFSTIGGNVATNAGGLCCVKYGVTADYVLGLELVLADGSVVRTGRRTVKGVAGYDLTRLFVGSEGTLGVITEITLRLRPPRTAPVTVVAELPTLPAAGAAVVGVCGLVTPALLEIMDRTTIRAVEDWKRMGLDRSAAALLLAQCDGPAAATEAEQVVAACEAAGATSTYVSADAAEAQELLAARRLAYPALERLGATLLDDVAVPRRALPTMLAAVERIAAERGVVIGTFGHAGDGNLHPTIVFDRSDESSRAAAGAAFDDMVGLALDVGGTVTGEHGVGTLKRGWLETELGPAALDLHRRVKSALDPAGLFNPGKVLQ